MPFITVTAYSTAAAMAQATIGTGVSYVASSASISSATTTAYGTYSGLRNSGFAAGYHGSLMSAAGIYGSDTGLLVSTGLASEARGANTQSANTDFGVAGTTGDTFSVTYQITSDNEILVIPVIFASEEYPGYIGLTFTDYMSLTFDGVEIGYIPGTSDTIAVNHVNENEYPEFYKTFVGNGVRYNAAAMMNLIQFVEPGSTHTLTFTVIDVSDGALDSALFIGPITSDTACELSSGDLTDYFEHLYPASDADLIQDLVDAAIAAQALYCATPENPCYSLMDPCQENNFSVFVCEDITSVQAISTSECLTGSTVTLCDSPSPVTRPACGEPEAL